PVGSGRFELYSEPPPDAETEAAAEPEGFWWRHVYRLQTRWRDVVRTARHGNGEAGLFARARDAMVTKAARAIAEQRTLWVLRHGHDAELVHPSDLSAIDAVSIRDGILARARTHHVRWLFVDTGVFVVSGVFMLLPGPNVLAYYFAFRVI